MLAQERFDCADDPGLAADFKPVADLELLLTHEMPGRDDLVAAAKLIAIVNPSHRQPRRYVHHSTAGLSSAGTLAPGYDRNDVFYRETPHQTRTGDVCSRA